MMADAAAAEAPSYLVLLTGCITVVFLSAFFVVQRESQRRKTVSARAAEEAAEAAKEAAAKIIDATKFPGGQVTIYYATQTGTAESFAQQLEREGPDHGFHIRVVDLEDVGTVEDYLTDTAFRNKGQDETARVIVLAATYGEGEPTDNANEMVQLLKEKLTQRESGDESLSTLLKGLEFCVFGLGNRQYEHFNAIGKFFDDAFHKLGGTRVLPLGMGDDDADLEGDFETWKELLWKTLQSKYGCPNGTVPSQAKSNELKLPKCEYAIEYHTDAVLTEGTRALPSRNNNNNNNNKSDHHHDVHGSARPYFSAIDCPVTKVQELRSPKDGGSTKHVEIDISHAPSDFSYTTADNLGVLPLNDPKIVESVAAALGYDLNAIFSLKAAPGQDWHGDPMPMPLSVRDCLTRYMDLTSAPRRSDLKLLAQYATNKLDRQALLRLSSKEGKQEYKEKIMQGYVGMADLLKLCPSLQIPLEHFISVCHFLLPRYYTIASSSSVHPTSVHLTVAVTQESRPDGTLFHGVCSTHLAHCRPQDTVRILVRPSTFRLPSDPSRPILMIGPGTGIAPMRALLQERYHQKSQNGSQIILGRNVLYFGCKQKELDYLYQEELNAWQAQEGLTLYAAFSRETPGQKVYVQHLLKQNAAETWDLVHVEQGSIYVCGGVKMGHDVTEALKEILVQEGEMSFDQAKDYLAQLASSGRFVQELWA